MSEAPILGDHPFVCPQCCRRSGIRDLATGISTGASCGIDWRGPRVGVIPPTAATTDTLRDAATELIKGLAGDE